MINKIEKTSRRDKNSFRKLANNDNTMSDFTSVTRHKNKMYCLGTSAMNSTNINNLRNCVLASLYLKET